MYERLVKKMARSLVLRSLLPIVDDAGQLSQDRCELQFSVKELVRRMEQPNTKNMQAGKPEMLGRVQQTS